MERGSDGAKSEPADNNIEHSASNETQLDRDLLNDLTTKALEQGTYFGRGLELTESQRNQLSLVAALASGTLEPRYNDQDWQTFQKLVEEGTSKGVLMSFTTHPDTFVPTWCIDGGESAVVKKVMIDGKRAGIEVPSKVFNLYHWRNAVESLNKNYVAVSNETLRGRSTGYLGEILKQLAILIGGSKPSSN